MKVIVDFCLIPIGVGTSLSSYVAACQKIFQAYGLKYRMHAYGTNLEGDWKKVFKAIEACHTAIHKMGAPRISSTLRMGTRADGIDQGIDDKIASVEKLLKKSGQKRVRGRTQRKK